MAPPVVLSTGVNQFSPDTFRPPVFLLVGWSQHGKSSIRDLICEDTGVKGASCSDVIYGTWARLSGIAEATLRGMPKEAIRPKLKELGDWMVGHRDFPQDMFPEVLPTAVQRFLATGFHRDPTALVKLHLDSGVRALDGIRRPIEFQETVERIKTEGFQPVVVWVQTKRDTSHVAKDSFSLTKEGTCPDLVIDNDGTFADLRHDHGSALAGLYRRFPSVPPVEVRKPATMGMDIG